MRRFLLACACLAACSKSSSDPAPSTPAAPPPPTTRTTTATAIAPVPDAAVAAPAPAPDAFPLSETETIVRDAFGAAYPALPALSADGASAAVLIQEEAEDGTGETTWVLSIVPLGKGKPERMTV